MHGLAFIVVGLALSLLGFWNDWFNGVNIRMSGQFWYVFEAGPVYAIAVAAVLIVVLLAVSVRWNVGFEFPCVGVLALFVVLAQWLIFIMGCMEIGGNVDLFWSSVEVRLPVYVMLFGQALMVWGSIAAWTDHYHRRFHEI